MSFTELYMAKAYGVGTIRTWKGKKYIKGPDKKWRRYYDKKERGTGIAIAYIMKQINNLEDGDVEGLMRIIQANASRFRDQNGNMLPEVAEIHNLSQKKQGEWENKPAEQKEPETKEEEKEDPKPVEEEKEEPKQEEKQPEEPKEEDKAKDLKAEAESWKKEILFYRDDHEDGVGHWFSWASDPHQDVSSKAWGRAIGIKNLIKMRETLKEKYDIDTPSIPDEIMNKYNDYVSQVEKYPRYAIPGEVNKLLSGIKKDKLFEIYNSIEKPLRDKFNEISNQIPKKNEEGVTYKRGLSNKEQAELFTNGKDEDGNDVMLYDGKVFEKVNRYSHDLEEHKKMVEEVGVDPAKQVAYVRDFLENHPEEVASDWSIDYSYKRYGEKKLKEIVGQSITPDEEFYNNLQKKIEEKPRSYDKIRSAIREHLLQKRIIAYCQKRLDGMQKNSAQDNEPKIPISEAAMTEAKSIIGREVAILSAVAKAKKDGKPVPSYHSTNARQALADKIRRRARNEPEVCRAMFAYIREQDPDKKFIITSSNSLWDLETKLNDQVKEKQAAGEEETESGEKPLYSNDSGISIVENKDIGRYQIFFPGKPDYDTISKLKHSGWHWSPTNGAWQRQNTANGEYAMKRAAEMLGFEVKKSMFEKSVSEIVENIFKAM